MNVVVCVERRAPKGWTSETCSQNTVWQTILERDAYKFCQKEALLQLEIINLVVGEIYQGKMKVGQKTIRDTGIVTTASLLSIMLFPWKFILHRSDNGGTVNTNPSKTAWCYFFNSSFKTAIIHARANWGSLLLRGDQLLDIFLRKKTTCFYRVHKKFNGISCPSLEIGVVGIDKSMHVPWRRREQRAFFEIWKFRF